MASTIQKYKIPNNFDHSEGFKYMPAFLKDYEHYQYINVEEPFDYATPSDLRMGLFNCESSTPVEVFDSFVIDYVDGGPTFRLAFTFEITADVAGRHYFALYDINTEQVLYDCNQFTIIGAEEVSEFTLVEYKHSSNLDYINYTDFDIYQSIFLHMDEVGNNFEHTNEGVRERTTGNFRRQKNTRYKRIDIETYLFDEGANDGMASLSIHDDISLNKEPMTVKEAHEHENEKDFNLSKGTISFYVKRFSTINLNN